MTLLTPLRARHGLTPALTLMLLFTLAPLAGHAAERKPSKATKPDPGLVVCPAPLKVQELAASPSFEWSVRTDSKPRALAGITFFNGNPDQQASLAPDQDGRSSGGRERTATWTFGPEASNLWIACRYRDTGITLNKRLPASIHACKVRYGAGAVVKSVRCE